jgi:hypothetical protein
MICFDFLRDKITKSQKGFRKLNYLAGVSATGAAAASVVALASTGASVAGAGVSATGAGVSTAGATGASSFFEHPLKDATKPNVTRAVNSTFFILYS